MIMMEEHVPIIPPTPSRQKRVMEKVRERRLVISKMVLENFKSYAGRQEIGPFHKSFTSIVGPNGSGKSNVIDALLFVFGYRASKIRQGKLSELIHQSQNYRNLESCQVDVHFVEILDGDGEKSEMIPGSEMIISRIAYQNNKSQYYLNEKMSSFTQVTDLLKQFGIDLDHNRFLILQGEVESIAQMKPKAQNSHEDGLLEYLEDIIGTSKYKDLLEEAGKQVDTLNEQRSEVIQRAKHAEKEKDVLQIKRDEALDYLKNENALNKSKSTLWQVNRLRSSVIVDNIQKKLKDLNEKLLAEKARIASNINDMTELERQYTHTLKEYEEISSVAKKSKADYGAHEREFIALQENAKHVNEKIKKLEKSIEKEQFKYNEQATWIENFTQDIDKTEKQIIKMNESLIQEESKLVTIRDSLKGQTEVYQVEIEKNQKELAPWNEKINSKLSVVNIAKSEYELLVEKSQNVQKTVKEILHKKENLMIERDLKINLLQKQASEQTSLIKKLAELKNSLKLFQIKEEEMNIVAKDARIRLEDAKNSMSNSSSRNAILEALLKEKNTARIKGIYGRLGDLGTIAAKYDVAVTTACAALDNIVVDSTDTGQKCVEFLRKNNLGRATFIIMEKVEKTAEKIVTPENVPRLYDLIVPKEPIYANAFYFALKDTLVTDNLDQANRIAFSKQRFRVVTLDGKLIDRSGTMSGGGNKVLKGGMSSSFSEGLTEKEIVSLEKDRDRLHHELKVMQEKRQNIELELENANSALPEIELHCSKLTMDIESSNALNESLDKQLLALKKEANPDQEDINRTKELEGRIVVGTEELEELKKKAIGLENEIGVLQDKILEIGGVRFRAQQAKVDSVKEQIETLNENISKNRREKLKADKIASKALEFIEATNKEAIELNAEFKILKDQIDDKASIAAEVHQRYSQLENLLEEKKEYLLEFKDEVDKMKNAIDKLRKVELDIVADLEDCEKLLSDQRRQEQTWLTKMNALTLHNLLIYDDNMNPEQIDDTQFKNEKIHAKDTFPEITPEMCNEIDTKSIEATIRQLEDKLREARPNLDVIADYQLKLRDYRSKILELETMTANRDSARTKLDDFRKSRLDEFMVGFNIISQKLKEMYQLITLGGNAELELVDSLDPFSEGIVFSVMPPKKSWKNISNLSGGEKTLSSLALVFALHHYKPTPLYVMDEIDAALDFRNVSIVANYIKERTKNAQFVIISLRNNMFELADRLVGIYKTDNCTKSVTINPSLIAL